MEEQDMINDPERRDLFDYCRNLGLLVVALSDHEPVTTASTSSKASRKKRGYQMKRTQEQTARIGM
jgi:hypothetical protein